MKDLQKIGGLAAPIGAATNLLAIVMFITLAANGYGSDDPGGGFLGGKPGFNTRTVSNPIFGLRCESDVPVTCAL